MSLWWVQPFHLCAPSFCCSWTRWEHPRVPFTLLSSPLFIPHKLSLLFHHLRKSALISGQPGLLHLNHIKLGGDQGCDQGIRTG